MKVLLRTAIILAAAAIVVIATMGAMQTATVQDWLANQGGEHHGPPVGMVASEPATPLTKGATSERLFSPEGAAGEHGGRNSGSWLGLAEVAKNLGIVVVVSLVIAAISWAGRRRRPVAHQHVHAGGAAS